MKRQQYNLAILVLVVIAALVTSKDFLARNRTSNETQRFQAQVSDAVNSLDDMVLFRMEIELSGKRQLEARYLTRATDSPRAEFRRDGRVLVGEEAKQEIRDLLSALPPLTERKPLVLIQAALDHLDVEQEELRDFELNFELPDGTRREVELEVD